MRVFTWDGLTPPPAAIQEAVVTIGNFDGVHRGHEALLRRLLELKSRLNRPAQVVTFHPSPASILRPQLQIEALSTLDDRIKLFSRFPLDSILVLNTTLQLLEIEASDFWNELLIGQLKIQGMVEGRNFCFGKDRLGNIDHLDHWRQEKQIPLEVVDDVYCHEMRVSSSAIREALHRGDVTLASQGLGRYYSLHGAVVHGDHRGTAIGFPTCNLAKIPTLIPREGVYAARARVEQDQYYAAVNIGPNPTFNIPERKVEAHLLDFHGDLYGRRLEIEFISRLRDTRKFGSVTALQEQLQADVHQTRKIIQESEEADRHAQQ